jgi:putative membrane protein
MELAMLLVARRSFLLGAVAALPAVQVMPAFAFDALPDARFVGFAQQVNDFEIASGKLALAKSGNENVRGFATRMIADHTEAAQRLSKARSESGVSYAPDPNGPPHTLPILQRLNTLQGGEFDTTYVNAQLAVLGEAEQQYAANSNNQSTNAGAAFTGVMMRYARDELPSIKRHREMAQTLAGGR